MGKLSVAFRCVSCGHCCTDVVCLPTPFDVRRIALETGEDPYDFVEFLSPEEIEDVPKSDPTWLECDDDRYLMALRRHEKPGKRRHNGCYFLDQKTKK